MLGRRNVERTERQVEPVTLMPQVHLFQQGKFTLHSGEVSDLKIDCDALGPEDIACAAEQLARRVPPFSEVVGVVGGGIALAAALRAYASPAGVLLLADDVFTTGGSLRALRASYADRVVVAAVIFARDIVPSWVYPWFQMTPEYLPSKEWKIP